MIPEILHAERLAEQADASRRQIAKSFEIDDASLRAWPCQAHLIAVPHGLSSEPLAPASVELLPIAKSDKWRADGCAVSP